MSPLLPKPDLRRTHQCPLHKSSPVEDAGKLSEIPNNFVYKSYIIIISCMIVRTRTEATCLSTFAFLRVANRKYLAVRANAGDGAQKNG